MPTRHEAAVALDIPIEMAKRHGIPSQISRAELAEILAHPPQWLLQSRANRQGKRPVWATLSCVICGMSEQVRPKKWWPEFTLLACDDHESSELPTPAPGTRRSYEYGIGTRFFAVIDAVSGTAIDAAPDTAIDAVSDTETDAADGTATETR